MEVFTRHYFASQNMTYFATMVIVPDAQLITLKCFTINLQQEKITYSLINTDYNIMTFIMKQVK